MYNVGISQDVGIAGFVDVETTGLSAWSDEIVEFALVLFAFGRHTGRIVGVVEEYVGMREPSVPIHPRASAINGITVDMVRGK
ncbi:MAG: exonuclease domain-containing protein, partial [Bacillota bacterium]